MTELREKLLGGSRVMLQGSGPGFRGLPVFDRPNEGEGGEGGKEGDGDPGDGGKAGLPGLGDGAGDGAGDKGRKSDARSGSLFGRAKGDGEGEGEGDKGGDKSSGDDRPEGVPEKFWDADKGEIRIDALTKAYSTLETAHAKLKTEKGFKPPEKEDDYFAEGFEMPKEADRAQEVSADDPGIKAFQKVAFKYGLPTDVARGMVKDMFLEMNEHLPEPVDEDAEFEKLGKNAESIVTNLDLFITGMENEGTISGEEADFLYSSFGGSAIGMKTLMKMRGMMTDEPLPTLDPITGGQMTADEWQTEYNKALDKKDEKRMQELDALGENIFGNQPGMSSNLRPRMR